MNKLRRLLLDSSFTPWLYLLIGLGLLSVLRVIVAAMPPESAQTPYVEIWLRLWLFIGLALAAGVAYFLRSSKYWPASLAVSLGLIFSGIVLLGLKGTPYGLNGIEGDAGFLTAQITKFATFAHSVDFAYQGLPAFYPPLELYIFGRIAAIANIEPYRMLRFGLIFITFLLPFLTQRLWRPLLGEGLSLLPVLAIFLYQYWYKPGEWLTLFLFVPWWLHYVEGLGERSSHPKWTYYLIGGLIGAAIFTTYYYWFFIAGLYLLLSRAYQYWRERKPDLKQTAAVLGLSALFSSPYWLPFALSLVKTPGATSLQNRYFVNSFISMETPFFDFSLLGLVFLCGLLYLLFSFRSSRIGAVMLSLLGAAYLWQFLGYFAFMLDLPLLTFKARDFINVLLAFSALLALHALWNRYFAPDQPGQSYRPVFLGLMAALLLFFGQQTVDAFVHDDLVPVAHESEYPTDLVNAYISNAGEGYAGHVIWGERPAQDLSIYLPVYQFVSWAAHFSHPAGQYYERIDFLIELSEAEDPVWFAAALMNNRYSQVDEVLLFLDEGGEYRFSYRPENFPYPSETMAIFYPKELLETPYFEMGQVESLTLFDPRYAQNPILTLDYDLNDLSAETRFGSMGEADDMLEFLDRFAPYIDFEGEEELHRALQRLFPDQN